MTASHAPTTNHPRGTPPIRARRTGLATAVPANRIERRILLLRGEKVMLDADIAHLYGVRTKALNRAVKRNADRFPADFMFQLTREEARILRCQFGTSSPKSEAVTPGWGGRRRVPFAFTEQGVAMLSSVLRSKRAVQVNIEIMRAFVRLRSILASHVQLGRRLDALERKYDGQFKVVFDAIREMMTPPAKTRRPIGFRPSIG